MNRVISTFVSTPTNNYVDIISKIIGQIPTDHNITIEEINKLNVYDFQIAFYYLFPHSFSVENYTNLNYLISLVYSVMTSIPDNAIVLAPGDSPSKVIALINLLFRIESTDGKNYYHYTYQTNKFDFYYHHKYQANGRTMDNIFNLFNKNPPYEDKTKRIQFIQFPITGLQKDNFSIQDLSKYLQQILIDNKVDYNKELILYDLDYASKGITHNKLEKALKLLNPNIQLRIIDLNYLIGQIIKRFNINFYNYLDIFHLIDVSEQTKTRCMPKYNLFNSEIEFMNLRGCNLIVTMLYLLEYNALDNSPMKLSPWKILETPKLPYSNIPENSAEKSAENFTGKGPETFLIAKNFYMIRYFNFVDNSIEQFLGYLNYRSNEKLKFNIIELNVDFFREEKNIILGSITQFAHIPAEEIYANSVLGMRKETIRDENSAWLVGYITLINGVKVKAQLKKDESYYRFDIPGVILSDDLVLDFEPTERSVLNREMMEYEQFPY